MKLVAVLLLLLALPLVHAQVFGSRCQLTFDNEVPYGGSARLSWRIIGNPHTGSITPAVLGIPDFTERGSAVTGPLFETTTYTMTVSDSHYTNTCKATVPVGPEAGYEVTLVQQAPIFTRTDIPGGFDGGSGHFPFTVADAMPNGNFVVSGHCSGGGIDINSVEYEGGGMYLFTTEGTFVNERDVCHDSADRSPGCQELRGCQVGWNVIPVSENLLIRQLSGAASRARSPILYETDASGFHMVSRIFFNDRYGGGPQAPHPQVRRIDDVVHAGGKMITTEPGATVIYDLPAFNELARFHTLYQGTANKIPILFPIFGAGNFFLGAEQCRDDFARCRYGNPNRPLTQPKTFLYEMPSDAELQSSVRPRIVQEWPDTVGAYAVDPSNPNRIALSGGEVLDGPAKFKIYTVDSTGWHLEAEYPGKSVNPFGSGLRNEGFALMGEYIAYSECLVPGTWPHCKPVVEKDGQRLTVEPLPRASDGAGQRIRGIALAPNGNLLVTAYHPGDNGNIYLYKVGGSSPTTPPFTVPENFAPPEDPFHPGYNYLSTSDDGTNLIVSVAGPGKKIYTTGYYSQNNQWKQFSLTGSSLDGIFIDTTATGSIPLTELDDKGWIIAYACEQYGGSAWICGPRSTTQSPSERYWTMQSYKTEGTAPPPSCSHGTCANPGSTRCVNQQEQTCQPDGCWSSPHDCEEGTCNIISCQSPESCDECELGEITCGCGYGFGSGCGGSKLLSCQLVNGCKKWRFSEFCPRGQFCEGGDSECRSDIGYEFTDYCDHDYPNQFCILVPGEHMERIQGLQICEFPGWTYGHYLEHGCYRCEPGYHFDESTESCIAAQQQNLKIMDIITQQQGNDVFVTAQFCKTVDAPVIGTFDYVMEGDRVRDSANSFLEVPLCPSTDEFYGTFGWLSDALFFNTGSGSVHEVTVRATFPAEYNSDASDDSLTKTVTLP